MSQLFRYVSAVSSRPASSVKVAATNTNKPAVADHCGCNYKDNYYGDQVCLIKTDR